MWLRNDCGLSNKHENLREWIQSPLHVPKDQYKYLFITIKEMERTGTRFRGTFNAEGNIVHVCEDS
jgi:hypothetical protein